MSSSIELHVAVLGEAARRVLAQGEARVFAAFERSCYVETAAGIACVGSASIGRGPLNAILAQPRAMPVVGSTLRLRLDAASTWKPPCARPAESCVLGAHWARRRPKDGLAAMVDSPSSVEPHARRAVAAFTAWVKGNATGRAPAAASALIGLGPGLTPAGDDFVGGALIALHARGSHDVAARIGRWALALAERRTGRISRAHLACAARGEAHEALHALLAARDPDAVVAAMDALDRVGHSSGWDAAAGALAGLGRLRAPSALQRRKSNRLASGMDSRK